MTNLAYTEDQKNVITHKNGPLMVIAGAGTGKTRTITGRITRLINEDGINPESILALTFTEKAAQEMYDRVIAELPLGSPEPFIGTFHAFADSVLRSHGLEIGLDPKYTVLKDADLIIFLRQHAQRFSCKYYRSRSQSNSLWYSLAAFFGRLQDEAITPEHYMEYCIAHEKTAITDEDREYAEKHRELAGLYGTYLQILIEEGKIDYAGLTFHAQKLLATHPSVAHEYGKKYAYVIVDEYQDTNIVQNQIVDLIGKQHRSIMVVGDDDQAIYKWRGASLYNILSFKDAYPDAKMVVLRDNFRSTQPILDSSYAVIQKNNPHRLEVYAGINKRLISHAFEKKEISDTPKQHPLPEIHHFDRSNEEINFVITKAARLVAKHQKVAIVGRTNALLKQYIEACIERGIFYETSTTIALINKPIVKDILAILRVVLNPWDDLSLYRILLLPAFSIAMDELHDVLRMARAESKPLYTLLSEEQWHGVKKIIKESLEYTRGHSVGEVIGFFLQTSGYLAYAQKNEQGQELTELAQFSEYVRTFEQIHKHITVADFLEYIGLAEDIDIITPQAIGQEEGNALVISTIHGVKGLEFDAVFIVGVAHNKFPTINRSDTFEIPEQLIKEKTEQSSHVAEERRLFYVACTRAREKLYISYSDYYEGVRKSKPSIFCEEARSSGMVRYVDHAATSQSALDQLAFTFSPDKKNKDTTQRVAQLSYSQLSTYQTCPRRYYYSSVLGLPQPPNASMSYGISLHNTLRDFSLYLIDKAKNTTFDLLFIEEDIEKLKELFEKNWISKGYSSHFQLEENKQIGWESLQRFFYEEKKRKRIPYDVEKSFSLHIDGVKISGRIDRIDLLADNTYEIIDYKTGKSSHYNVKRDLQLSVYALAAQVSLHIPVSVYSLIFLESGEYMSSTRSAADISECKEIIKNTAIEIANSGYEATPGYHCYSCPYRMICPFAL